MSDPNIEPATSYFASRGITDERIFTVEAYFSGHGDATHAGWRTFCLPLTDRLVRRLREAGYTAVSLSAGGRTADFRLNEFWSEQVGLGQWRSAR